MKKENSLIIALLVVLTVVGWISVFKEKDGKEDKYNQYIDLAEDYVERRLYQKAINEYEKAIEIENKEEDWKKTLTVYAQLYADNADIYDDYLELAKKAVLAYPNNKDFLIIMSDLYLEMDDYISCYKGIKNAIDNGLNDQEILDKFLSVKYSYELGWKSYFDYVEDVNGYYIVLESDGWRYLTDEGEETSWSDLTYASMVGDSGVKLINSKDDYIIVDSEEIIQGRINFTPEASGVYSEGIIPVKKNGKYAFYDLLGDKLFGDFEMTSSFVDEKAAVKENTWFLINTKGEKVGKQEYEDIVLTNNYSYIVNDVMIAQIDGEYRLFDSEEKQIGTFSCSDVDCVQDKGWIAFCRDKKWGYVDQKGEVKIEPQYVQAKSFSNGLAAVYDGENWGFINSDNSIVIDYSFKDCGYFNSNGCCMVKTDTNAWFILTLNIKD